MNEKQEEKTTNEKTVKIPLTFKEALGALLKVKPQPKEKAPKKQKSKEQKKPSE